MHNFVNALTSSGDDALVIVLVDYKCIITITGGRFSFALA